MTHPPIRILDAAGSPADIGRAHGLAHAEEIRAYTRERVAIATAGLWSGGRLSAADVLDIAESMLPAHASFDDDLHLEMEAMAEAAGISLAEAVIVGGFTDFVDTVRAVVGGDYPVEVIEDDCTAVLVPDHRSEGAGFLAQTWDMHDSATDHVILLRLRPDDAPSARVFTTTGCLGQIGMNSEGVAVGINNLTCIDGRRGVTWPSVVRGMLKASTADEALDTLMGADLAGAHNFLILDREGRGYNVEAMPSVRPITELRDDALVHTNHALDPRAVAVHAEKPRDLLESSLARLRKATELIADGPVDAQRLFDLTAEPEAICAVATEPFHIESSGGAVMRPRTGDFWACWGRPAENDYDRVEATPADVDVVCIGERSGLRYTHIRPEWAAELAALELASYPDADPADLYDEPCLRTLAEEFSEGCFAALDGNRIVAMGLGVRCDFDLDHPQHTIHDIVSDDPSRSGHDPDGEWYYGTGVATLQEYRRRGIGTELYELRKQVCRTLDLRGIIAGSVMPGYADHKHEMSADDYIAAVREGRLYDPTLTFQLSNGFEARCALAGYIENPAVDSYAALIVWHNPDHSPADPS